MAANETTDRRRYGVIETRFRQHGRTAFYRLTINRELWACVEWSPSRRAWCVQDASGRCLAHCDAIHGEHIDASTAVELAKAHDPRRPDADAGRSGPTAPRAVRPRSPRRAASARHHEVAGTPISP